MQYSKSCGRTSAPLHTKCVTDCDPCKCKTQKPFLLCSNELGLQLILSLLFRRFINKASKCWASIKNNGFKFHWRSHFSNSQITTYENETEGDQKKEYIDDAVWYWKKYHSKKTWILTKTTSWHFVISIMGARGRI